MPWTTPSSAPLAAQIARRCTGCALAQALLTAAAAACPHAEAGQAARGQTAGAAQGADGGHAGGQDVGWVWRRACWVRASCRMLQTRAACSTAGLPSDAQHPYSRSLPSYGSLIREFEREARTDGMPANELNLRKKQYVQELNGFIGLKKAYSGAAGQRAELLDGAKMEADKLSGVQGRGCLPAGLGGFASRRSCPSSCLLSEPAAVPPNGMHCVSSCQRHATACLRFVPLLQLLHRVFWVRHNLACHVSTPRHEHDRADAAGAAAGEGD